MYFEEEVISNSLKIYEFVGKNIKNKTSDFKTILSFNLTLIHYDKKLLLLDKNNEFFKLMILALTGKIKVGKLIYDFSTHLKEINRKNIDEYLYFYIMTILISLDFISSFDLEKSVKNQFKNGQFLLVNFIDNMNDYQIEIDKKYLKLLLRKVPSFLELIYKSDDFILM